MNFFHLLLFLQIFVLGNFGNVDGGGGETSAKIKEKIKQAHTHIDNKKKNILHPTPLVTWTGQVAKKTLVELTKEFAPPKKEDTPETDAFKLLANQQKIRYNDVRLIEDTRVELSGGKYIHANYIHDAGKAKIICTQGPKENTIDDFWQMIFEQKIEAIVMVTDTKENDIEKCAQYWPNGNDKKHISSNGYEIKYVIEQAIDKSTPYIVKTTLEITTPQNDKHTVFHFHWKGWADHGAPTDPNAPFILWKALEKYNNIAVHCSAGIGRTGTIVAIQKGLYMMEKGNKLDIPSIVMKLREERAGSVQKLDQYLYIYNAFLSYAKAQKKVKIFCNGQIDKLINQITNQIVIGTPKK